MKLINESAFKHLSVKLPMLGAFFMLVLIPLLQWALDYQLVPTKYESIVVGTVLPILAWVGRKIYQPSLHQPLGFVGVTAGHSNSDPGAVRGSQKEAEFVTNFRNALAFYLMRAGLTVKTDGSGAINLPLTTAIQIVRGATTKLEIHLNAAANSQAYGVETIAMPDKKKFAQAISAAVVSVTGSKLRGEDGWIDQSQSARGRLGFVSNGGMVLELEFLSNPARFAVLQDKYWLVAEAVADIIIAHEKVA